MGQTDDFEYESIQDSGMVRSYMMALIDGIEKGRIKLHSNGQDMVMEPGDLLKFEIKARKKDGTCKMAVKLSWKENRRDSEESRHDMEISS